MITKTTGYKSSDGVMHASIEEAQRAEIIILFSGDGTNPDLSVRVKDIAEHVVRNQHKILDILTTSENSRPKARAINGAKKPRKPKAAPVVVENPATSAAA